MTQDTSTTSAAPTPEQDMAALVSKVADLSKLALDMTRLCIEVNENLPAVIKAKVDAAVAAVTPAGPQFYRSPAPTPDDMETMFPPGYGDHQAWHVVCIGRRPGLYANFLDADDQVRGVPNQSRKKKDNRQEALLYYRTQYGIGECERVSEAPPASNVPPAASSSLAAQSR